jgi:hypothetical protein
LTCFSCEATNESTTIELESLQVDNGSEANKLGQGGCCAIYEVIEYNFYLEWY